MQKANKLFVYFLCLSTLIYTPPLKANIGWTHSQIEAKYGAPKKNSNEDFSFHYLEPQKFPRLNAMGFNEISFDYINGKVVSVILTQTTPPDLMKILSTPVTSKAQKEKYDSAWKKAYETKRGTMSFDDAKLFAVSYVEADGNVRSIRNEKYYPTNLSGQPDPHGNFNYKGWQVRWELDPSVFQLVPAEGSAFDRALHERVARQMAVRKAQQDANDAAGVRSETR